MADESLKPWRKTTASIKVTYQWWYDTVAILDEYDDTEEGILPAGEFVKEFDKDESGTRITCDLYDKKKIEKSQLPKGRIRRIPPFSFATPLQAVLAIDDFNSKTEITATPKPRRLLDIFQKR